MLVVINRRRLRLGVLEVSAKPYLQIDTISKGNDKPWNKLIGVAANIRSMERYKDSEINFDFKGIVIGNPCNSSSFMKLLGDPKIYLTIYNNESVAESIRIMCILNGQPTDRVTNVCTFNKNQAKKVDKQLEEMAKDLLNYFETSGNRGVLYIQRRFDQIGVARTVDYIRAALIKYVEETGNKDLVLFTANMSIQPSVIKLLARLEDDVKPYGATLHIVSQNNVVNVKLGLSQRVNKADYTLEDRMDIARAKLKPLRVGVLHQYKDGKAKDEFGRQGKGEMASSRIAIVTGVGIGEDKMSISFRTYNGHKFYTKAHWMLENDGERLNELEYTDVVAHISELGIYNDFLGSKYHFVTAVQQKPDGLVDMYSINENGSVVKDVMTIPERAKAVFDDFGIKYDEESLNAYIEATREKINPLL